MRRRAGRSGALSQIVVLATIAVVLGLLVFPKRVPEHSPRRPAMLPTGEPVRTTEHALIPTPAPSAFPIASPQASLEPAAEPTGTPALPQVAIIIDDCGQWPGIERGYIGLPIALTMSVMPHVRYTAAIAEAAAAAGKGVMLHLPMEPLSHINPGAGKITTAMSDAQIVAQTQDDLAQVPLAKGVNNHEGSAASADARVMRDVIGVVKEHDLFFVDSMTNAASVAAQTARSGGVPTASRDVFLDNREDVSYSESMLERAVQIAKERGSAIAIGHPRATTLAALANMYPKMQSEGVRFVLVSELVR